MNFRKLFNDFFIFVVKLLSFFQYYQYIYLIKFVINQLNNLLNRFRDCENFRQHVHIENKMKTFQNIVNKTLQRKLFYTVLLNKKRTKKVSKMS